VALVPYYEHGGITIYHGDCREVLPQIEDIKCCVTSPPYNQKLDKIVASGFMAEGNSQWASRISGSYFDSKPEDEYESEQIEILSLIFDITARNGSLFYNHKCRWRDKVLIHPVELIRKTPWKLRQEIIWARDGSLTQNAKMFPPSEERIIWCFKDSWHWNQDANRWMSVWRIDSAKNTPHPVAFPIDIPRRCIVATTDQGDVVLDPFMGSGTTLRAAKDLGRKAIGIEIEERYCEIAANRLRQEVLF